MFGSLVAERGTAISDRRAFAALNAPLKFETRSFPKSRALPTGHVTHPVSLHSQWGRKDFTIGAVIFLNAVCKVDRFSVGRPARRCCAPFRVRDQTRVGAIRVHDEYLVAVPPAVGGKRDLLAIRRPRRPTV